MFENYLKDSVHFNGLNKDGRADFIISRLLKSGLSPQMQVFTSCFGKGKNIFVRIGDPNERNRVVISAHYDGNSLFDNTGGVIALMNIAKIFLNRESSFSTIILFTDQEENYQQGAACFLRSFSQESISKNINIDGFGLGNCIYSVSELTQNSAEDRELFLCDSDEFKNHGIPSTSYFSAFEEDFNRARNENQIYATFNKYKSKTFFESRFAMNNINSVSEKLYRIILDRRFCFAS